MTPDQFKAQLKKQGKTIRQWAVENGFEPEPVYRVLNSVEKGNYGQAHNIAVAAGIKATDNNPANAPDCVAGKDRRISPERRAA